MTPHPDTIPLPAICIDRNLGKIIRERRIALGLSQQNIGDRIGVSFQQVQKYERGSNRLTIHRLFDFAAALELSVMDILRAVRPLQVSEHPVSDRQKLEIMKRIHRLSKKELKAVNALIMLLSRESEQ